MIGMHVCIERKTKLQAEFRNQCGVAPRLLEHGIDQYGFSRIAIGQQVGVRTGLTIDELPKNQHKVTVNYALDPKAV
jgi:hypothetical protein